MPETLAALVAFVAEHQRCGDLDCGTDNGYVWVQCSWRCGCLRAVGGTRPSRSSAHPAKGGRRGLARHSASTREIVQLRPRFLSPLSSCALGDEALGKTLSGARHSG